MKQKNYFGLLILVLILILSMVQAAPSSVPTSAGAGATNANAAATPAPAGMVTLPNGDRIPEASLQYFLKPTACGNDGCQVADYERADNDAWKTGVKYDKDSNVWTVEGSKYKLSKSGMVVAREDHENGIVLIQRLDVASGIYVTEGSRDKPLATVKTIDSEYVYFTDGSVAIGRDNKISVWPESVIRSRADQIETISSNKITLKDGSTIETDDSEIITITTNGKASYVIPSHPDEELKSEDGWVVDKSGGVIKVTNKARSAYYHITTRDDGLTEVTTSKDKTVHVFDGNREVSERVSRESGPVYQLKDANGRVIGFCQNQKECTGSLDNPQNILITEEGKLCQGCSYDEQQGKVTSFDQQSAERAKAIDEEIKKIPPPKSIDSIQIAIGERSGPAFPRGVTSGITAYKGDKVRSRCADCLYYISETGTWIEKTPEGTVIELTPGGSTTAADGTTYDNNGAINQIEGTFTDIAEIKKAYQKVYAEKKQIEEENAANEKKKKELEDEKNKLLKKGSAKIISPDDAKKACDKNEKDELCLQYREYINIQDEQTGALFVGNDFLQGRTLQPFTRVVNALGQYEGWQGIQNWWFPDAAKSEYVKSVTKLFDRTLGAKYQVPDAVCKGFGYDPMSADTISSPGQSAAIIDVGNDQFQSVAAITAERTDAQSVALCAEDVPCKIGHCSEEGVCLDDTTNNPLNAHFYKISWSVRSPADEANTPYVDENGYSVFYNVMIYDTAGNSFYLYPGDDLGFGSDETLSLKGGESDNDVYIAYSPVEYSEICIDFGGDANGEPDSTDRGPKDIDGDVVETVCADFAISSASENIWAKSTRSGSRGSVRVADLGRKQI